MAKKTSLANAQRPMGNQRPRNVEELIKAVQGDDARSSDEVRSLPIDKLRLSPYQPRRPITSGKEKLALVEMANSIRAVGVVQPIVVRPLPNSQGDYEIVAGERRWRAAQLAELSEIPVIIRVVDNATAAAMALVENLQRQDLNAMDEALAMQRLINDFDLSQVEVGKMLGKSKSLVSKTLGLLSLAEEIQRLVVAGELDAGHARILITLDKNTQIYLGTRAAKKGWSVRELEKQKAAFMERVQKEIDTVKNKPDPNIKRLESKIGEWLAASVSLKTQKNGGGYLTVRFNNTEECNGILEKIGFLKES